MQKIYPCLWFDIQAEEATRFYTSLFERTKIGKMARYGEAGAEVSGQKKGSVMVLDFELEGLKIAALNGGPVFKHTSALSLFVWCETEREIDGLWQKLAAGGVPRMSLDKYPWAQKYGWTADQYGVEWQLTLSSQKERIAPAFLFVKKLFGKGEEAIRFYMSLFENSKIESMVRDESTKSVQHCKFSLSGTDFVLMEGKGAHGFTFSPAFSLVVNCKTQEEIDHYWTKLSQGGSTEQGGWVKDKYGVSWQIVPEALSDLMSDSRKSENVMKAMLQMGKLDIRKLVQASEQGRSYDSIEKLLETKA